MLIDINVWRQMKDGSRKIFQQKKLVDFLYVLYKIVAEIQQIIPK